MGRFLPSAGRRLALPVWVTILALCAICSVSLADAATAPAVADLPSTVVTDSKVTANSGDNAWMLTSSALVMLMVPGLALFYAGMVRRKNVLGTMMQSMAVLGIIGIEW